MVSPSQINPILVFIQPEKLHASVLSKFNWTKLRVRVVIWMIHSPSLQALCHKPNDSLATRHMLSLGRWDVRRKVALPYINSKKNKKNLRIPLTFPSTLMKRLPWPGYILYPLNEHSSILKQTKMALTWHCRRDEMMGVSNMRIKYHQIT